MRRIISPAALVSLLAAVGWADPVQMHGKLDSVTVYRGQAMVTRLVTLPQQVGLIELVITDLPERIVPGSVFTEGNDQVQVRSVLFRTRAISHDVRDEVRKFDEEIEKISNDITAIDRTLEVNKQNSDYLGKLEQFNAPTAQAELAHGVLNAETLEKITKMIFEKREMLSKERLANELQSAELHKQAEVLNRQRSEITGHASNTAREAVLLVDAPKAGGTLRLNYLVDQATWSPSYTLNARTGDDKVSVIYQAAISQLSGEDWSDVNMTLSTASPSLVARAPTLEPLALTLARIVDQAGQTQEEGAYVLSLQNRRSDAVKGLNVVSNAGNFGVPSTQPNASIALNANIFNSSVDGNKLVALQVADDVQKFELTSRDKGLAKTVNRNNEQVIAVNYALPARTTLQSRSDEQLVGISTIEMKGSFYKVAMPVLTPFVYDEAALSNGSKTLLLAGPSVAYLNGQFVGHGAVPTTAVGGSFTAGFGIDASLRAARELVDRSDVTQGGNVVNTYDYRISIENFSDKPASVRVMDRIPKSDGNQLKPTLVSTSIEISKDTEYERTQKKLGLLRFDLQVPAQAINGDAKYIDYRLTIEHDRQLTLLGSLTK